MGEGDHHGRQLLQMDRQQLEQLAARASEHGITLGYHLPIEGLNPAAGDPETTAVWQACKRVIHTLRPSYILFHPGENASLEKGIASTADFIKKALTEVLDPVQIVIENVPQQEHQIGSSME